jgi:hypothetical protein
LDETTIVLACRGGDGGAGEQRFRSSIPSTQFSTVSSFAAGGGGKSVSFCGRPELANVIVSFVDEN